MGIYSYAHLSYGIDHGDSAPWHAHDPDTYEPLFPEFEDLDVDDLGEFLALKSGAEDPWENMPEDYEYEKRDEFPEFRKKVEEWDALKKRLEDQSPVDLHWYGSEEWTGYVVRLKDDFYQMRGDDTPTAVSLPDTPTDKVLRKAQEFCEEHGLGDFSKAGWIMYGSRG
jgi:hypothetical protein